MLPSWESSEHLLKLHRLNALIQLPAQRTTAAMGRGSQWPDMGTSYTRRCCEGCPLLCESAQDHVTASDFTMQRVSVGARGRCQDVMSSTCSDSQTRCAGLNDICPNCDGCSHGSSHSGWVRARTRQLDPRSSRRGPTTNPRAASRAGQAGRVRGRGGYSGKPSAAASGGSAR
jgi:hypothetical protein